MDYTFPCHNPECEAEIEVEVEILSPPTKGTRGTFYDPPDPGEAAEWDVAEAKCEECGRVHSPAEIAKAHSDSIEEQIEDHYRDLEAEREADAYDRMKDEGHFQW